MMRRSGSKNGCGATSGGCARGTPVNGLEQAATDAVYTVIETPDEEAEVPADFTPIVVAETTYAVRELSVSDAVQELDLTGTPFIVSAMQRTGGSISCTGGRTAISAGSIRRHDS